MNIKNLLEYNQYLRHSYLETLSKLPWDEFVKDRQASFGSLRDIFLHCMEVSDRYVGNYLQGKEELPRIRFDDFGSMEQIRAYVEGVEANVNRYLSALTPEELSRKVQRRFKDGSVAEMTVEDILIDLFQEETHHRGEFIALLWQMGIEPPHLGWGKYITR